MRRWGWLGLAKRSSSSSPSSWLLSPSPCATRVHRMGMVGIGMDPWYLNSFLLQPHRSFGSMSPSREKEKETGSRGRVTREWLAPIWKEEIKLLLSEAKRGGRNSKSNSRPDRPGTEIPLTPTSTSTSSTSPEGKLASLLSTNNLVIMRDIEWANVLFSFEQESRYIIMDAAAPNSPAGYIRETSNLIYRQLLRSRRPFVAHIIDSQGNEIFRVRRPFWLINSTIFAEVDGKEIGVVHRRWHLWRRIYDLYLGNRQFAVVENPGFWNWTFTLKDEEDNVLAQIDRNWRGIGLELFTDAGQYVIRFGASAPGSYDSDHHIEELDVVRPLTLSERAVALALAVSLDCDYFSRRGGWGLPIIVLEE